MTPAQFLNKLKRNEIAPAYLFLGPEAYERDRCREFLIQHVIGSEDRENALTQHDLEDVSLAEVLDDARSLSLFANQRIIVVANAEAVLPRGRAAAEGEESEAPTGTAEALSAYLKAPSPGVVMLLEASRHDFEGEDKKKLERVRKFYSAIPDTVEFRRFSSDDARIEAQAIAHRAGLTVEATALDLLVEALGADIARIAVEIEKLALYAGEGGKIRLDDITDLVPDARSTTIFALVNALGRRDRVRALEILDTLTREGEYLPLALSFLSTQFRMALVSREAGLRSPQQIQSYFYKMGVSMWGARAEQVYQTLSKFSGAQLKQAMRLIYEADKDLRSARPDDRITMEQFVLQLTA